MNRSADVIVVGGGVVGCAVAYELSRRGVDVLLLDSSLPGRATSASAGGLWPIGEAVGLGCGVIYHAAQTNGKQSNGKPSANGDEASSPAVEKFAPDILPDVFRDFLISSDARFPKLSGTLGDLTGVDIEYGIGAGLLFVIYDDKERAFVDHVGQNLPPQTQLEMLSPAEALQLEPLLAPDMQGCALLPGEHQVNPMLLAEAFKRAAVKQGAVFRHQAQVTAIRRTGDRVVGVEIGDEFIQAGTVVNAAGSWSGRLAATLGIEVPVFPVRGQIVLTETLPHTLSACLSTSSCYLCQKDHGEVLIGSTTEDVGFDVSVTEEGIRSLCSGAIRTVPMLKRVRLKRVWAGLRPATPDELPILGPVDGLAGYINATGGFRTGIVASPLTGEVVAQMVCSETPGYPVEAFHLDRFSNEQKSRPALSM